MATRLTPPGAKLRVSRRNGAPGRDSKYDWDKLQKEYVEGTRNDPDDPFDIEYPSAEQLSAKHGIPQGTIQSHITKYGWVNLRQQFQLSIQITRQRTRRKDFANKAMKFDRAVFNVANLGIIAAQTRLQEITRGALDRNKMIEENRRRMAAGEKVELPVDGKASIIDAAELDKLASAADRFSMIGRRVLGEVDIDDAGLDIDARAEEATSITQRMNVDNDDRLARAILAIARSGLRERIAELDPAAEDTTTDDADTPLPDTDSTEVVIPDETTPPQHHNPTAIEPVLIEQAQALPFPDDAVSDLQRRREERELGLRDRKRVIR